MKNWNTFKKELLKDKEVKREYDRLDMKKNEITFTEKDLRKSVRQLKWIMFKMRLSMIFDLLFNKDLFVPKVIARNKRDKEAEEIMNEYIKSLLK